MGVPYLGVLIIRILLFSTYLGVLIIRILLRVLYLGPLFSETPISRPFRSFRWWRKRAAKQSRCRRPHEYCLTLCTIRARRACTLQQKPSNILVGTVCQGMFRVRKFKKQRIIKAKPHLSLRLLEYKTPFGFCSPC